MSKTELRLQFLKLEQEGYGINSRSNLYKFGADNYQEFPAWKYRVSQFATNHLTDHPYYQQLANSLSINRDRINDFSDILRDMNVIGKDDEYWQEQGQQMPMVAMYGSTSMQAPFFTNNYTVMQPANVSNVYAQYPLQQTAPQSSPSGTVRQKVFIVHGHDEKAKLEMARTLEKLGFDAIILHEQANAGRTIIEKIAAYSDVAFAVVLYTECDYGRDKNQPVEEEKYRARQNVVFEHGYLIGKLGRDKVSAFVKGAVETPGDISGVVYVPMDTSGAWKQELVREMHAAGLDADLNKLI